MRNRLILTAVVSLLVSVAAFAEKIELRPVEAKKVCMVNEQVFERDQIPVEVNGRTYYGCCEMCKKTLAENATKRVATDPFSGNEVDKAVAIIAADENGSVYYFENADNLEKYNMKRTMK